MSVEFYQQLYNMEWTRRHEIQSSVAVPLGLLTVLGGGLIVFLQQFHWEPGFLSAMFGCSIGLAIFAFIHAAYLLVCAYQGFVYHRIPWPSELREFQNRALEYHWPAGGTEADANLEFEQFLLDRYVEAADRNSVNNVKRGEYLQDAVRWIIITLVLMAIAAIPYIVSVRTGAKEPQRIQIIREE